MSVETRQYRGSDNAKAVKPALTARPVKLVPRADLSMEQRPALLPGRKSCRERRNVWVPA